MSAFALYDILKREFVLSECDLCEIIKMRAGKCLNALCIILLKCGLYMSECASYDIIKIRAGMCQNALYIQLVK